MISSDARDSVAVNVYKVFHKAKQMYWQSFGGRKEAVFGRQFRFASSTHFPSFRGLRFPKREIFSTIVRYGDYVQTHSAYLFLMEQKEPPVVIDIGAHHGVYAVLLGKLVQEKKGKVIAVEPNPSAFKVLQENVRLNGLEDTVACERVAIMKRPGTLHITDADDQSRIADASDTSGFAVEAMPLSILLKKYSITKIDVMIIDVEGAELSVLQSFDWKKWKVGKIFCELHPYNWKHFGFSGTDMSGFLEKRGLRCFDMYLREHREFTSDAYIGPALLVSDHER